MAEAPDSESGQCRFESCLDHLCSGQNVVFILHSAFRVLHLPGGLAERPIAPHC